MIAPSPEADFEALLSFAAETFGLGHSTVYPDDILPGGRTAMAAARRATAALADGRLAPASRAGTAAVTHMAGAWGDGAAAGGDDEVAGRDTLCNSCCTIAENVAAWSRHPYGMAR